MESGVESGEGAIAEEKHEVEPADEEGRRPMRLKQVVGPTMRERVEHDRLHLPYRSWCPVCVAGRGANHGHKTVQDELGDHAPEVSFDYCFLRDYQGADYLPVLVGCDRETRTIIAHAVPNKGADVGWTAEQVCRDLKRLGHFGRVTLRSDQEPALVSFLEEVAKLRGAAGTVLEHSPVGESQANGRAERAVRTFEEILRVHKLALEGRIGENISVQHSVFPWLIEFVAVVINKHLVGKDGRTAYERMKHKLNKGETLPFGCQVMLRVSGKVAGGVMGERWFPGTWLGTRASSGEHLVARGSDGIVVRTRVVKELPEKTTTKILDDVLGKPWAPMGVMTEKNIIPRADSGPVLKEFNEPLTFVPRSMFLTKAILQRFGHTATCSKCRALTRGEQGSTAPHSK